jgi:glycosyltransferase involved in cell wall biosynthesis
MGALSVSKLNVLYFHPAGAYGGASKSLIELYQAMRLQHSVHGTVLTPFGSASVAFADAGMSTIVIPGLTQFDNTLYGHYKGLRWLILLRELAFLPGSLLAIWRLRGKRFDLLHVNEVTLLPLALFARKVLGIPMVVHVRSLQCKPGSNWRTMLINYLLKQFADAVISIDHTVAKTLDPSLPISIIHNGILLTDFGKFSKAPRQVGLPVRVGFMGVLIELKGVYELVEAMGILKGRGVAIECVIAGENARDINGVRAWALSKFGFSRDVRSDLAKMICRYGLEDNVKLLGFVKDVQTLYQTFDILCFPSHLNAAGRPVFEAAFYEVPSVIAVNNPLPDAVLHGQTGIAISRSDALLLADAIQLLAEDDEYRMSLGRNAKNWALEQFSIESSASVILSIYLQL